VNSQLRMLSQSDKKERKSGEKIKESDEKKDEKKMIKVL